MELALIVKLRLSTILIRHKSDIICVKNYIYFDPCTGWSPSTGLMAYPSGCLASESPAARRTCRPYGAPVRHLSPYARLAPCVRGDVRDRLDAPRWRPRPRVRGERRLRSRLGGVPQLARL